ncbi:MAG: hypothetical protein AB1486_29640 [Planctomycetota bacterium]
MRRTILLALLVVVGLFLFTGPGLSGEKKAPKDTKSGATLGAAGGPKSVDGWRAGSVTGGGGGGGRH